MAFQTDTIKVDKQITLYKRNDHSEPLWQVRIRVKDEYGKNRYLFRSTGEAVEDDARKAGYRILLENEVKISVGVPVFGMKFPKVWAEYLIDQQYQVDVGALAASRLKTKKNMTRRWIASYFKDTIINQISDDDMREFWKWRINFADSPEAIKALKEGGGKYFAKKPKYVTLNEEKIVINQIFKFAVSKKYMKAEDIPDTSHPVPSKIDRRYPFSEKEMEKIRVGIKAKIKNAPRKDVKNAWLRLFYKVLVMHETGMRPTEAINLKWGDYHHWFKDEDQRTYTNAFVHGKGKERTLTCKKIVGVYLNNYKKKKAGYIKDTDYVFSIKGKKSNRDADMFTVLLTELELLKDRKGGNRTLYSLRHTYATQRLLDGNLDWDLLGINMGTSTAMLRQHYGHVVPQQKAKEIVFSSKIELSKKKKKDKELRKKKIKDEIEAKKRELVMFKELKRLKTPPPNDRRKA